MKLKKLLNIKKIGGGLLLIALILSCMLLTGCDNERKLNKAAETYELENLDDSLGAMVNYLEDEELDNIANKDYVSLEEEFGYLEEKSFIIPLYIGTNIKIQSINYLEDVNSFEVAETVFEKKVTDDDYAIEFDFVRPEVLPAHMITMEYDGKVASYIISYNGKDGNPRIEYIALELESEE